ncbi:MAG: hypothetical protein AAF485_28225, partial [Chloroflexota bacterium]
LHFKVPFIEALQRYDRRILEVDPPVQQVIMADQRRLELINTQSPGAQWDSGTQWGARLRRRVEDYLAGVA